MKFHDKIDIRQSNDGEFTVCAAIYTDAWNFAFPEHQRAISVVDFEAEVVDDLTLVAVIDRRIIGYIAIWEPEWFIHHLYIDPLIHGNGVGTALISHLERLAAPHSISLKCLLNNTSAMGFYKALGFMETSDTGADAYGNWARLTKTLA